MKRLSSAQLITLAPIPRILAMKNEISAACVGVVFLEGGKDLVDGDLFVEHPVRIDLDFIRSKVATRGVDLNDTRNRSQRKRDVPVKLLAQLHQSVPESGF